MKIVVSGKELKDHDLLEENFRKDWKENPITVYIVDKNLSMPQKENPSDKVIMAMKALAEHEKAKAEKKRQKKREEEKKKIYKSLRIPKSLFFSHSTVTFVIFLFMIWNNTSFNFLFWFTFGSLIHTYYEMTKNINNFYDKKMRELNIPYETESQKEIRIRDEMVKKRIKESTESQNWDKENYERKYSLWETISGVIYYFFASFFPSYIDRQLDIFQKEYNLIQSRKRIMKRRKEFERKKAEEKEKKMKEANERVNQEEEKIIKHSVINTYPHQPSKGDDPLEVQEFE